MTTIYDKIYQKAEPYWDTRQNDIHVPLVYDFAQRLLTHYPKADEDIVLPAILLHDIGWKMVPEARQLKAFGPHATDEDARRLHETEGVRLAGEILTALNYDIDKIQEILSIIDGHDTRHEALSLNDKLVKDADKLWRFTPTGINIDHHRFGIELEKYLGWISTMIDGWMFTPEAKTMAQAALAQASLPDAFV